MHFCLIRHAEAVDIETIPGQDDSKRTLTEKGWQECHALAAALKKGGIELGTVVTSPYLRAVQTAEKLSELWTEPKPTLLTCEHLACGGKLKKLARYLQSLDDPIVTLVGHMPDLAILGAWLIGSKKAQITLAKSGAAWIDCDTGPFKGSGLLTWLLTPTWFQAINQG